MGNEIPDRQGPRLHSCGRLGADFLRQHSVLLDGTCGRRDRCCMSDSLEPLFSLIHSSEFRFDGVWEIKLTIRYRDGMPPEGSATLGEARHALAHALIAEGERGRTRGAAEVCVLVDQGTGEIVVIGRGGVITRSTH